jgi:streptogramin lyase
MRGLGLGMRAAIVASVSSAVALVGVLAGGGTSVRERSYAVGGSLAGNPLVVPYAEALLGGQVRAAEAAKLTNPQAVAARLRSRTAYGHLSSSQAQRLLRTTFNALIDRPASAMPRLPRGSRVIGYPTANTVQLALPGHQLGVVESSWPVAKRDSHGHYAPVDLTLTEAGSAYEPSRATVDVRIPKDLSSGVQIPSSGVTVTPLDAHAQAAAGSGTVDGSTVVYANTQRATDTVVKPTPTGLQLDDVLRSPDSPGRILFNVSAPSHSTLVKDPLSGAVRVALNGATLATILPPGASDAAGTTVPASMSVDGMTIAVEVAHRAGSYLYPIAVDPEINDSQLATTATGKRAEWEFKSSNESRFGHKAVYEGPGKEHLETTGTAEYGPTEFAYWAYETKGNSKIYEVKTKTSAKNVGAKIESFLEIRDSSGAEQAKKLLSTELSEPEYSEKVVTVCGWNASKVEECLPGAGKEKNAIRFQQSATASPGSGFKFSDTLNEGVVSISEPAGEHSTASFNTTSPEVEGEVEEGGKKVIQKRVNALYGAGSWLSNFKGALQLIGKDPGIGVAKTRLEYEKSAGVWEQLSSHDYLESENACLGVQCYSPEHKEYWTLDPKLPDGLDKIRYRAEEAIAGTVSLEGETESIKTVKVDTKAPHGITLIGLPWGNELTEKPYKLEAVATDGAGTTVAASGVKSLALFVAGHEVAELGKQVGCTVTVGECSAKAEWSLNGAELGAGHHAIVIVVTDNAGNESRLEETISIRHSMPVPMGPGSVDLQSGDFTLSSTDASFGSGLTVSRNYSSRDLTSGNDGPLGGPWDLATGTTESLVELVDGGVLMTAGNGGQSVFAPLAGGKFESPQGDSNLELSLEEDAEKHKLAYYLKDNAKHTSVKFTRPTSTSPWVPTKQEGTVASDTVTYSYQASESRVEYKFPSGSRPTDATIGLEGNMWLTEQDVNKIARVTPTGKVTEYSVTLAEPQQIATGPEGQLWYTSGIKEEIDKMTPSGTVTKYTIPGRAVDLTAGPDGNIWYVDREKNTVVRLTTSGSWKSYFLPAGSWPKFITAGPDGNLWFAESGTNKIGKITPLGGITEYALPAGSQPEQITTGPDGKLWFVESGTKKVGKITTTGVVTEYSITVAGEFAYLEAIAAGPDGNIWVGENQLGTMRMWKVTTSGVATKYQIPGTEGSISSLVSAPDGNVWYISEFPASIGIMPTSGSILEPTQELAPKPSGVSCEPELKPGCRALKFRYATTTTATGEAPAEWGEFKTHLTKILLVAYEPVSKTMQETTVAEYSYDKLGRLRAEWDPRVSPALKTTYGYDDDGHVTAMNPPGQQAWAFTYGTSAGDMGTGRLVKLVRPAASVALWNGEAVKNTEAPSIFGSAYVGNQMLVNGKWSGGPLTYGFQWEDCTSSGDECAPIPGATNQNYYPALSDVGHKLVAVVTATNGGGSVVNVSAASGVVTYPKFTEFALPTGSHPYNITAGPDGKEWFTNISTGKVGKIEMDTGKVTEYNTNKDEPEGITSGPDGNLWFVEHSIRNVCHITTSGTLTTHTLTRTGTYNVGIVKGPDENLWFTESESKYIGKTNSKDEILGEYLLPAGSKPYAIVKGPDGNLWFTEFGTSKIGKITTAGAITEYALPAGSNPYGITAGPDGNLWFTDNGTSKIGKITTAGAITEYALVAGSKPRGIASWSDGKLYAAEFGVGKIAQVTTAGAITEWTLPGTGSEPNDIANGPDGNLWVTEYGTSKILRYDPTANAGSTGAPREPEVGYTINYGVPLSGSTLPNMTAGEVAKWGQKDEPVEATAITPPDVRQGWPASNYTRATLYYIDAQGRTVNVAKPSNAMYGSVSTTEYNELNDVVRTLSADNRQAALEAGSKSAEVSKLLDTQYTYNGEGFKETEVEEPGSRLIDKLGPQHMVKYLIGKEQKESLARNHLKYFYNEGAPVGEKYDLLTKTTDLVQLANEEEVEVRKTTSSYSGQSNLGWKLRAPTSVVADPEGKKLTHVTLYNSVTGQITETRGAAGTGGESAHDQKFIYYSAEANTEGFASCGSHPEWAGLVCETLPAKQPKTSGIPDPPVTTYTYNMLNEPLTIVETFGTTVRTKTMSYDAAGRLSTNQTTSTSGVALPTVKDEYSTTTGLLEKQSTTVEAVTKTVTSKYDTIGNLTEYIDADGNVAKYKYGSPENDFLLEEMTDGSGGGTGRQIYTYNATTKQLEKLWDSAAETFTAAYDADGNLVSEVYPNGMCANRTINAAGEATHIEYIKTTNCAEHTAPTWYSETLTPSARGEILSRTSTLSNDLYAYDTAGRLVETQETPAGGGCSVRLYGYDEESNRTSQTTRVPGTEGKCATEGGTVLNHTYDQGNRLTDAGIAYDSFDNVTKLPAADAEGHELVSTFYVDNAVATQSQNGVTHSYTLDPNGRVRETVTSGSAAISHYDGPGDAVAWTSEGEAKSTRSIPGVDGMLAAVQTNGEAPVLQVHDLRGNVVGTAALSPSETKLLSTYDSTEFGTPNEGKAPPKYAWLGGGGMASTLSSGVITYGATSYVPQTGRTLQSEAVEPPGAPQGTGAGSVYNAQQEPWVMQGAASEAAEAPGLEAAREQAAMEAAFAAATVEDPTQLMSLKRAEETASAFLKIATIAEILSVLDVPDTVAKFVEKYVIDTISLDVALDWYHDAGDKLMKCAHNNRTVQNLDGSYRLNICSFKYSNVELTVPLVGWKIALVYFRDEPRVYECAKQTSVITGDKFIACYYEVHVYKYLE